MVRLSFVAKRPIRSVRDKIRALTPKTSQQDLGAVLIRINQIMRGWTNYFKHAVAQRTFSHLQAFTWWRIVHMICAPGTVGGGRTSAAGSPTATAGGARSPRTGSKCSAQLQYRSPGTATAQQHPQPLGLSCLNQPTADAMESPLRGNTHGGFGERPGETDREQSRHRTPGRLNPSHRAT